MKSSIFVAATSAVLAMAGPVEKRAMETEVVVEYYTVTVTGNPPAATPHNVKARPPTPHQEPPAQEAYPTTPVVVVTVTPEPEHPKPTSSPATSSPAPSHDTPSKGSSSSRAIEDQNFQDVTLYHHNIHRSNHSSPEITWDQTLAQYAENTANTCHFAHDMTQGNGGYGQNIALWGGSSGAQDLGFAGAVKMAATDMWYNGEFNFFLPSYYGQATPDMGNFESWGHMSQLVWAASTKVGCSSVFCPRGTAYDNMDAWYTVCNYSPPGNLGGAYAQNVHQPKGAQSIVA